jgi:hypothetical protein
MTLGLRKRPLPLHAMGPDDLALDFAHRWWHARRDGGLLPPRAAVDTPEFRLLVGGVGWVDVAAPDPAGWALGPALAWSRGAGPFPADELAVVEGSLRDDLQVIRFTGSPLLQDLAVASPGANVVVCRQLLLPHADDGVRVRDLLAVTLLRNAAGVEPAARTPVSSRCQI